MSRASPIQNSFSSGEISPLLAGRTDLEVTHSGLEICLNQIPLTQGPLTARPGTYYANAVKDNTKKTILIRFQFSVTQAYDIEFGDLYCRFYKDRGRIESPPGTPVEIVTPYLEADLPQLKFTQSADVLYVAHPSYAPRKISRTSHTAWTISVIDFLNGPYLNLNSTTTTITPSATTGAGINLTASAALWAATDVGRLVRILHSTTWGYAKIVTYVSPTVVTADVKSNFGAATASLNWRLGLWCDTLGYPSAVAFYEDRLCWGGSTGAPQRLDGSKSGVYENMAPTGTDGTVAADNAVSTTLTSNEVNAIKWMLDDEKGLLVGTAGGPWVVRPSVLSEALSPTNISAKRSTSNGSADIQALRAGRATLYVQRGKRNLRELSFDFVNDGFNARDITVASPHIALPALGQMAYQEIPYGIIWSVRSDGVLVGLSYALADGKGKDLIGWHRHVLGGVFGTGNAMVESVAATPTADGSLDEIGLIVKRTINGATVRYVEYMTKIFEDGDAVEDAFFVDCGLTYSGAPATIMSGLDHLEGQTVSIWADGAAHPSKVVSAGSVTLERAASKVHIGLGYNVDGQTLRFEAGANDGTAQGKVQRIHNCTFRLHNTGDGLFVGPDFDHLDPIIFRESSDPTNAAVPLFTGDKFVDWDGEYSTAEKICWRHSQPSPLTLISIMPQLVTEDRG